MTRLILTTVSALILMVPTMGLAAECPTITIDGEHVSFEANLVTELDREGHAEFESECEVESPYHFQFQAQLQVEENREADETEGMCPRFSVSGDEVTVYYRASGMLDSDGHLEIEDHCQTSSDGYNVRFEANTNFEM
jgi:hypothetical protein